MEDKNKLNLFKKLSRLFSQPYSMPVSRIGSALKLTELKGTLSQFFNETQTLSSLYLSGYQLADRFARYADFNEMCTYPEINSALDVIADETCVINKSNEIINIDTADDSIEECLSELFFSRLNLNYNLWSWTRNMVKYGDFFALLNIHETEGVLGALPIPVNEVYKEEIVNPQNPMIVEMKYKWTSRWAKDISAWEMLNLSLMGNDTFRPYGSCLTSDTIIETPSKKYTIENIPIGTQIYCFNTENLKSELTYVKNKISNGIKDVYKISTKHREIEATENHPFLIYNNDKFLYKQVRDLSADDYLVLPKMKYDFSDVKIPLENKNFILEKIGLIEHVGKKEVWDIEVGNKEHNFVANGVVVHNSHLEAARRVFRQLVLIEDAMLAYRVVRAPERRVFYIDVGNTDPANVDQVMAEAVKRLKSQSVADTQGRIENRFGAMDVLTDYFLPKRGDTGPRIETLPGGTFVGDVDDVELIKCLRGNTKIFLLDGSHKSVEEITNNFNSKDFYTLSINPITKEIVSAKIVAARKTLTNANFIRVTLDNSKTIDTTPEHRYLLRDGNYIEAKELKVGDSLIAHSMPKYKIINIEYLKETEDAYDIQVDSGYENFALESGIFVHNSKLFAALQVPRAYLNYLEDLCLHPDTKVLLVDGRLMKIKDLIAEYNSNKDKNLYVYSYNTEKGIVEPDKINWCGYTKKFDSWLKIEINNSIFIECSSEHRLMLDSGEYIEAQNLKEGSNLNGAELFSAFYFEGMDYLYTNYKDIKENEFKSTAVHKIFPPHYPPVFKQKLVKHHKNRNRFDNTSENLELMPWSNHTRIHEMLSNKDKALKNIYDISGMLVPKKKNLLKEYQKKEARFVVTDVQESKFSKQVSFCDIKTDNNHNFLVADLTMGGLAGVFVHNSGKATLCIDLNTKIPLLDGRALALKEIIDMYEKDKDNFNLWAYSINTKTLDVVPGKISWAGITKTNTKVVEVVLDNNDKVVCTPEHQFMLRDGSYKKAIELVSGDSLMPLYMTPYRVDANIDRIIECAKISKSKKELIKNTGYSECLINRIFKENNMTYAQIAQKHIVGGYKLCRANHKVKSINQVLVLMDTGCITVDKYHNFAIANEKSEPLIFIKNSQLDIRFSKTISRIQKFIVSELTKIALIHLICKGFEKSKILEFELFMNNPSNLEEMQKLELWRTRLELARDAESSGLSMRYVQENFFNFTDDDIVLVNKQKIDEAKLKHRIENISEEVKEEDAGGEEEPMGSKSEEEYIPGMEDLAQQTTPEMKELSGEEDMKTIKNTIIDPILNRERNELF